MLRKLFGNDLYWLWIFYAIGVTMTIISVMIWTGEITFGPDQGGLKVVAASFGPAILGGMIFMHVDYLLERRRFKKTHPEWK